LEGRIVARRKNCDADLMIRVEREGSGVGAKIPSFGIDVDDARRIVLRVRKYGESADLPGGLRALNQLASEEQIGLAFAYTDIVGPLSR